jgi:nucleotide-binding universal stress UspA family protein
VSGRQFVHGYYFEKYIPAGGQPPADDSGPMQSLLLASEGRRISPHAIDFTARIALKNKATVRVLSIARVWGTALGLPNAGLLPNKHEWEAQRSLVADAIRDLKNRNVQAEGEVIGTRQAAKRIVAEANRHHCDAIVMGADAPRNWLVSNLLWSQEPYRVRRSAGIPVFLIVDGKLDSEM